MARARRLTRMVRAHPSSASVRAPTLREPTALRARRKTDRNQSAKRWLEFPRKQDIEDRAADLALEI